MWSAYLLVSLSQRSIIYFVGTQVYCGAVKYQRVTKNYHFLSLVLLFHCSHFVFTRFRSITNGNKSHLNNSFMVNDTTNLVLNSQAQCLFLLNLRACEKFLQTKTKEKWQRGNHKYNMYMYIQKYIECRR